MKTLTLLNSYYNPCSLLQLAGVLLPLHPLIHQCIHRIMDGSLLSFQTQYQKDWRPPNKNKDITVENSQGFFFIVVTFI